MRLKSLLCSLSLLTTLGVFSQNIERNIAIGMQKALEESKITKTDMSDWKLVKEHTSSISGVHHIYFRQSAKGLAIYGTESSVHVQNNGTLIASHINFIKGLNKNTIPTNPIVSPIQAVLAAANHLGYTPTENLTEIKGSHAGATIKVSKGGISLSEIPVELMLYRTEGDQLALVWDLSIQSVNKTEWYSLRVDAHNGRILDINNWMTSCNFTHDAEAEHIHLDSPFEEKSDENYFANKQSATSTTLLNGSYEVFAMPLESPLYGNRTIETGLPYPTASPYGWHDTDGISGHEYTDTRGNNVDAYEAGDNPGYRPDGGSSLVFHFPFDPVYTGGNQSEDAAITNLFYWNNIIHDVFYMYGFDEASGNFQVNNYGNGGLGNDAVHAEAQTGILCNAFFGTPADGSSPTMYMYVCSSRDGCFDNLVMMHEYGHGISNRLTGPTVNCLGNEEQMGEGWSDYFGLMLTMRSSDSAEDARGIGTYLFGQSQGGPGIRTHPYSTDMSVNPHTYDDIKSEWAPHGVGSVWSAMLWDMTWLLIDEYGFDADFYEGTGGNNIALALVTEGLKLQPCSPGFVDGRDAILNADVALFDGDNECAIWHAFARRGLGYSAIQGSSNSKNDGTEAFDMPPSLFSVDCPTEDVVVVVGEGETYILENFVDSGEVAVNSACDLLTYTVEQNPAIGTELSVGTHPVTVTIVTSTGQEVSCAFNVVVTDVADIDDGLINSNNIIVFPNPTDEQIFLTNNSSQTIDEAVIIDIQGKVLDRIDFSNIASDSPISLTSLAAGTYFIKFKAENATVVKRIVKK